VCKYLMEEEIAIICTAFMSSKREEITQCIVITDATLSLLYMTDNAFKKQV